MSFLNYKIGSDLFDINDETAETLEKLAYSTSAHPQIYESDGIRFTVTDLVAGQGMISGKNNKKIKPNLSSAKRIGIQEIVQSKGFGKVK